MENTLHPLVQFGLPPLWLTVFFFVTRFIKDRLPAERLSGWRWFSIGGYIVTFGMTVAFYFALIRLGAAIAMIGMIVAMFGMTRMFLDGI